MCRGLQCREDNEHLNCYDTLDYRGWPVHVQGPCKHLHSTVIYGSSGMRTACDHCGKVKEMKWMKTD